jgi:signal transduction histidine kinase/CheY-like chemotaxis protein
LRLRILVVALMPLLLAVSLFAAYFTQRSVNEMEQSLQRQGQDSAHHLSNAIAFDLFSGNLPPVKHLLDYERNFRHIEVAAVTDGSHWLLLSGKSKALPTLTGQALPPFWRNGPMLHFAHSVRLPAANDSGPSLGPPEVKRPNLYLLVSLSRAPVELTRSQAGLAAGGTALIAIVFAMLLAWRLSGGVSRPLLDITQTVAQLTNGNLTERTAESSQGEIGLLERGINRMAQALEQNQRNLTLKVQDATAELLGQKLAAEAAVQAKSRFLAAASHDLRQPLHAMTLLVAALREQVPRGEAGRLVQHIEASAAAMESLLNALLDLSKLDAGVVEARPVCFPISKAFNQVASQFLPVAQSRGIRLAFATTSLWAYSDPVLVERVIANLVSNALRYTERGGVLVGARRVGQDWIRFEVWDTGKGIPAEFQARIFEEYFQLENPERHRDKGLGLGLAIVTRLARLLGSRVQVRSEPGQGACFSFQLARCEAAPTQPEAVTPSTGFALPLENALVAFIDDDEAILAAMVEVFDHWNVALAAGEDAEQVRAELLALGRTPDLILCDYRLRDGHTGVEAVQLLRDAFGANIPAALLTGDTATDTIQAIQASHLPVLHKPLKPAKLRAFLSHLLADPSGTQSSTNRSEQ